MTRHLDRVWSGGDRGLQQTLVTASHTFNAAVHTWSGARSRAGPVSCHALPHAAQDVSRVQKLKIYFGIFFNYVSLSVCDPWH